MVDRATLWSFVGVLRRHWFAAMSGGFSVPFTAAAVYFDSKYAQSIFGFLALASLYFAAYQIWKSEHDKVLVLQESLSPTRIREIEAQEKHAAELQRHTDALEREERANTPIQLALKAAFEHKGQAQVRQIVGEPLEPFPNWVRPSNRGNHVSNNVAFPITRNSIPTSKHTPQKASKTFRLVVTERGISHGK
jgi:hypothetical protein